MTKKIILAVLTIAIAAFGLDWGIYGGPGISVTMTGMSALHSELDPAYDVPSIPSYQIGLSTPIVVRLWNFTLGGGDSYSWQSVSGEDYKISLHHSIDMFEFGYVVNLGENLRLRPVMGIGDYDIDLRISRISGGFGDPDNVDFDPREYDYDNTSIVAGASLAYLWKFENRVIVGLEAKARYLVPLEQNAVWESRDSWYRDANVTGFYPHTPIIGLNFVIGYEKIGEDEPFDEEAWQEWEEGGDEE